jgi:crotonobetainyl-CoA:carnitine CoA-transferase CaiB-like acyl-CoA transferase
VQSLEPKFYAVFLDRMGLKDDPQFTEQFDPKLWPRQSACLAKIFGTRTRDEWANVFEGSDACVAPVLSPDEAMHHPMNHARGVWSAPDGDLQAAPAPRFSTREAKPGAIPARGQDTNEILAELRSAT